MQRCDFNPSQHKHERASQWLIVRPSSSKIKIRKSKTETTFKYESLQ